MMQSKNYVLSCIFQRIPYRNILYRKRKEICFVHHTLHKCLVFASFFLGCLAEPLAAPSPMHKYNINQEIFLKIETNIDTITLIQKMDEKPLQRCEFQFSEYEDYKALIFEEVEKRNTSGYLYMLELSSTTEQFQSNLQAYTTPILAAFASLKNRSTVVVFTEGCSPDMYLASPQMLFMEEEGAAHSDVVRFYNIPPWFLKFVFPLLKASAQTVWMFFECRLAAEISNDLEIYAVKNFASDNMYNKKPLGHMDVTVDSKESGCFLKYLRMWNYTPKTLAMLNNGTSRDLQTSKPFLINMGGFLFSASRTLQQLTTTFFLYQIMIERTDLLLDTFPIDRICIRELNLEQSMQLLQNSVGIYYNLLCKAYFKNTSQQATPSLTLALPGQKETSKEESPIRIKDVLVQIKRYIGTNHTRYANVMNRFDLNSFMRANELVVNIYENVHSTPTVYMYWKCLRNWFFIFSIPKSPTKPIIYNFVGSLKNTITETNIRSQLSTA
ncbi:hypothetical protein NECID01_0970 [Nematocida sp. AWRm77]|nr:hypothetical protein NECID01_0970 [Nematocida sp. AWRm77]